MNIKESVNLRHGKIPNLFTIWPSIFFSFKFYSSFIHNCQKWDVTGFTNHRNVIPLSNRTNELSCCAKTWLNLKINENKYIN